MWVTRRVEPANASLARSVRLNVHWQSEEPGRGAAQCALTERGVATAKRGALAEQRRGAAKYALAKQGARERSGSICTGSTRSQREERLNVH